MLRQCSFLTIYDLPLHGVTGIAIRESGKSLYLYRLGKQLDFISLDSPGNARKFKAELLSRIKRIPSNPYRYRKSIYFENANIRDLIYKGYTVVFLISNNIEVFGFVKFQKTPTD
ncbi:MAG: type II toxin-antitoxin system RelE/ParE family toxin [Lentimicrobium sp.]|nr:type II toxin-antitoxin system RelE/ParE family toxin [Lentimicrobium sp.]